jgi:hypothetical protein
MLLRPDDEGLIAITQPTHAWVSGQIARHWGNQEFSNPGCEPCFAAEQHDIGFLAWELAPTLDAETGLPHSFLNMPDEMHVDIWASGVQQLLRYARYPALLVSLHFSEIGRQARSADGLDGCGLEKFLKDQEALQHTLLTSLRNDAYYGADIADEKVDNDRQFVSFMDWMSLLICSGFREEMLKPGEPREFAGHTFRLAPALGKSNDVTVAPWPFQHERVRLVWEGRRLLKRYADEAEMREALRAAARITMIADLVPG